jgi:hypothetical protein
LPGWGSAWNHAVQHDLVEQGRQQLPGQLVAVQAAFGDDRPGLTQRGAVQPLHDQHPLAAQRLVRDRDPHGAVGRRRHRGHVGRLDAEVELLADGVGEADGQLAGADGVGPAGAGLQGAGQAGHDVQVALDRGLDPGPLDLDRDLGPGPQPGRVHLGDRGGGQGPPVEVGEQLGDRPAQLGHEDLLDLVPGGRGDVVLEPSQLVHDLPREQVRAGGQHLAELDEGDPGLLQGLPRGAGQALPAGRGVQLGPSPPAPQVRAQAVADRDPADLGVAAGPGQPAPQRPPQLQRPRQRAARHQGLGHDQEHHGHHQRRRPGQEQEPQRGGRPATPDGPGQGLGDGPDDREPDQPGQHQPHQPEAHPQQPPGQQGEPAHDRGHAHQDQHGGQGDGQHLHRRPRPFLRPAADPAPAHASRGPPRAPRPWPRAAAGGRIALA